MSAQAHRKGAAHAQRQFAGCLVKKLRRADVPRVGGKNASLGERVANLAPRGVKVPPGFAVTAEAYWHFIDANGLQETISAILAELSDGKRSLAEAGAAIRQVILRGEWPKETAEAIRLAYGELNRRTGQINMDVDSLTKLVHYTRRELICLNEPTHRRQT
jgi:pyruvate,water dikinase